MRAGYGIYYNPNQMNSFTFLTNNPPIAAVTTYTNDPANPTLSFDNPSGVAGPITRPDMISPTRDLPNARKSQWSFDLQREIGMGMAVDLQYLGSHTDHLDRSFFNNTPQPGAGDVDARRPSQRYPQPPHHRQRPDRRLRRGQLHPAQEDVASACRPTPTTPGRRRATSRRTRTAAAQTMDNYDIRCATTARPTGTFRTASWRATSTTCRS